MVMNHSLLDDFSFCRIGFAIAERLLEEGCKVVVSSRRAGNVAEALKKLALKGFGDDKVLGLPCHAANKEQMYVFVLFSLSF
jgi:NAD(P)-dependent dehydrogenase (short-subunit alcohol dehydrogenase family)